MRPRSGDEEVSVGEAREPVVREPEEDHDLLTYNEAGAGLAEEIQRLDAEAARLQAAGSDAEAAAARGRADALRAAADRNSRRAQKDTNARGFLEYRPGGSAS
jgi:hypothetical protein